MLDEYKPINEEEVENQIVVKGKTLNGVDEICNFTKVIDEANQGFFFYCLKGACRCLTRFVKVNEVERLLTAGSYFLKLDKESRLFSRL